MNPDQIETAMAVLSWLSDMEHDDRLDQSINSVRLRLGDWLDDLTEDE